MPAEANTSANCNRYNFLQVDNNNGNDNITVQPLPRYVKKLLYTLYASATYNNWKLSVISIGSQND